MFSAFTCFASSLIIVHLWNSYAASAFKCFTSGFLTCFSSLFLNSALCLSYQLIPRPFPRIFRHFPYKKNHSRIGRCPHCPLVRNRGKRTGRLLISKFIHSFCSLSFKERIQRWLKPCDFLCNSFRVSMILSKENKLDFLYCSLNILRHFPPSNNPIRIFLASLSSYQNKQAKKPHKLNNSVQIRRVLKSFLFM